MSVLHQLTPRKEVSGGLQLYQTKKVQMYNKQNPHKLFINPILINSSQTHKHWKQTLSSCWFLYCPIGRLRSFAGTYQKHTLINSG